MPAHSLPLPSSCRIPSAHSLPTQHPMCKASQPPAPSRSPAPPQGCPRVLGGSRMAPVTSPHQSIACGAQGTTGRTHPLNREENFSAAGEVPAVMGLGL